MCEKRKDALAGSCAEIWAEKGIMTWNRCVLCGSTRATDSGASFHRFPADKTARARWIANLQLGADAVKPYSRLRHFPGGDPSKEPPRSRRFISRETVKRGSRVCCTCRATENTSIPSHDTNNYPFSAQISAQEPARASFLFLTHTTVTVISQK